MERVDRSTGAHADGIWQSQMMPRAHGSIWCCPMVTVGGLLTGRPAKIAANAESACCSQGVTMFS